MQLLEDHIRREGKVAPGNVLRVDGFLNHQIDVVLLTKLAEEFHTRFSGEKVDKILTIEASGIAIGVAAAGGAIGMGLAIAKSAEGISRQPEAEGKIRTTMMLGLVFLETAIIYALLVVILIIFVL